MFRMTRKKMIHCFYLFILVLFTQPVICAQVDSNFIRFENKDFSIEFPKALQFVQKIDRMQKRDIYSDVYKFELAEKKGLKLQENKELPYLFITKTVLPTKGLTEQQLVELQRKTIAKLALYDQVQLKKVIEDDDIKNIVINTKEIFLNGRKFQTYAFKAPYGLATIHFYTFIKGNSFYMIESGYLSKEANIFNDSTIERALKSLVIKS